MNIVGFVIIGLMKINVGSKNKTKIRAVQDSVKLYPRLFIEPEIVGIDVEVDLFGHPKSFDGTVKGAIDRAKSAYNNCNYSFGLEGGLIEVPLSKSGFMEIGACAVYDGKNIHLGLSPAFEWPTTVTKMILNGKTDASQAFKQLGYTKHEKLGSVDGGAIGLLTNNRLTREDFTKYSIIMALIQLEKPVLYA
jgi:inosine/xanthosine triphosphatase